MEFLRPFVCADVRNIVRKRHDGGPDRTDRKRFERFAEPHGRSTLDILADIYMHGDESGPHHLPAAFIIVLVLLVTSAPLRTPWRETFCLQSSSISIIWTPLDVFLAKDIEEIGSFGGLIRMECNYSSVIVRGSAVLRDGRC